MFLPPLQRLLHPFSLSLHLILSSSYITHVSSHPPLFTCSSTLVSLSTCASPHLTRTIYTRPHLLPLIPIIFHFPCPSFSPLSPRIRPYLYTIYTSYFHHILHSFLVLIHILVSLHCTFSLASPIPLSFPLTLPIPPYHIPSHLLHLSFLYPCTLPPDGWVCVGMWVCGGAGVWACWRLTKQAQRHPSRPSRRKVNHSLRTTVGGGGGSFSCVYIFPTFWDAGGALEWAHDL